MLMTIKELYEKALSAKRPIEFFGKVSNPAELKKLYHNFARQVHPDIAHGSDSYIAGEAFKAITKLYNTALEEIELGIYETFDTVRIYKHSDPLFEISIKGTLYKFYENVFEGEVANIFKGSSDNDIVYLKVAIDPDDNSLLDTEYKILSTLRHLSLPYVEEKIKVNDSVAILMREVKGVTMPELMKQYRHGIPAEHVMWMLERLLSVVGYLHSNCVVHGNIKPENIIITKDIHNVSILGFSFCIEKANTSEASYKIVNDYYTAPEVSKTATVLPSSDVYSIGKIAIELLGGDIRRNAMPISVDSRVRTFIRNMVTSNPETRPNDAWKLWSELIKLRNEVFGTQRFKKLD